MARRRAQISLPGSFESPTWQGYNPCWARPRYLVSRERYELRRQSRWRRKSRHSLLRFRQRRRSSRAFLRVRRAVRNLSRHRSRRSRNAGRWTDLLDLGWQSTRGYHRCCRCARRNILLWHCYWRVRFRYRERKLAEFHHHHHHHHWRMWARHGRLVHQVGRRVGTRWVLRWLWPRRCWHPGSRLLRTFRCWQKRCARVCWSYKERKRSIIAGSSPPFHFEICNKEKYLLRFFFLKKLY